MRQYRNRNANRTRRRSPARAIALAVTGALLLLLMLIAATLDTPAFVNDRWPLTATFSLLPTPTIAPDTEFTFAQNERNPLPATNARLAQGQDRPLFGRITCNYPIASVTVSDVCSHNDDALYPYRQTVTLRPDTTEFSLTSANTLEGASLNEMFDFAVLTPGVHTLTVSAESTADGETYKVFSVRYYVLSDTWEWIKESDFNGSYEAALKFFGDPKRFVYRYQPVYGRYVVADPDWEETYITKIDGPTGRKWTVHIDAVPYYEKAFKLLAETYVRVHGTNGDTGVLQLTTLVGSYSGTYVSRLTSSKKTISHHAFGTASDINSEMPPNLNQPVNIDLINDEVRNLLGYNGILTEGGQQYYDFTYAGSYPNAPCGVPQTVINYILYELAFYRAGFLWGHYYKSTSDGMHFTLSDNIVIQHDSKDGLRKVFSYIEDAASPVPAAPAAATPSPDAAATMLPLVPSKHPAATPDDSGANTEG